MISTSSDPLASRTIADQVAKIDPKVKVLALSDKEGDRDFFVSHAGVLDPNVTALIETRKELAQSIFDLIAPKDKATGKVAKSSQKKMIKDTE